ETYPQNVRVLTQLYHLEKLRADQPEFETVARRLFSASTSEEAAQASLQIYKEYQHISQHFEALDVDTSLKLIMRFARVGELKEA
ncbi:hypothetical protein ACSTK4_23630, partial [Vibrio parahaemolyticus]